MSRNKKHTVTEAQIVKQRMEAADKALVLFIAAAMDEFGWTTEDVEQFSVRLQRYADAVNKNIINLQKVCEIIHDVMGLEISVK